MVIARCIQLTILTEQVVKLTIGFNHLFRMYRKEKPTVLDNELSIYFKSIKKQGAKKRQNGEGAIHNTKIPLPFAVYKFLSKQFISGIGIENQSDSMQSIFGHLFWLLSWNTMSRSKNTGTISLNHISWANDSLLGINN